MTKTTTNAARIESDIEAVEGTYSDMEACMCCGSRSGAARIESDIEAVEGTYSDMEACMCCGAR